MREETRRAKVTSRYQPLIRLMYAGPVDKDHAGMYVPDFTTYALPGLHIEVRRKVRLQYLERKLQRHCQRQPAAFACSSWRKVRAANISCTSDTSSGKRAGRALVSSQIAISIASASASAIKRSILSLMGPLQRHRRQQLHRSEGWWRCVKPSARATTNTGPLQASRAT